MRQLVGAKGCRRLSRETGLDVRRAIVRGNTEHRFDLQATDGSWWCYYRGRGSHAPELERDETGYYEGTA